MPLVSVFADVEDPINPLADPAALDLALLLSQAKVRGSFCLTGQKCRTLLARGRTDILDAYRPHCLGLHTDTHSYHPTTMELLADVPYEDGCELAYETEKRGLDSFVEAFGRKPAFWGGAGNTWSPEIPHALTRLGVPAYVYALTGDNIHRFNGCLAFPQNLSISEEDWAMGSYVIEEALDVIKGSEEAWLGVFIGHPTRFRHTNYWDVPFFHGRTPSSPEYAEVTDQGVYLASLERLSAFLAEIKDLVVGLDEVPIPTFRQPTQEEKERFREQTAQNLRGAAKWPIHRPDLDPQNIIQKTLALEDTLEVDAESLPLGG